MIKFIALGAFYLASSAGMLLYTVTRISRIKPGRVQIAASRLARMNSRTQSGSARRR